jgi:hypothetical protein
MTPPLPKRMRAIELFSRLAMSLFCFTAFSLVVATLACGACVLLYKLRDWIERKFRFFDQWVGRRFQLDARAQAEQQDNALRAWIARTAPEWNFACRVPAHFNDFVLY